MKPILLGVLCSITALQAEQPVKELSTEAIPAWDSVIPLFRHGYLVLFPAGGPNGIPMSAIAYGFTPTARMATSATKKSSNSRVPTIPSWKTWISVPMGTQP